MRHYQCFPRKMMPENEHRNSLHVLMTFHYPDLVSASDWLCHVEKFALANQKHYPDQGSDVLSVWNFCTRFLRHHFPGKSVVVSQNLGCFLRLLYFLSQNELNDM